MSAKVEFCGWIHSINRAIILSGNCTACTSDGEFSPSKVQITVKYSHRCFTVFAVQEPYPDIQ